MKFCEKYLFIVEIIFIKFHKHIYLFSFANAHDWRKFEESNNREEPNPLPINKLLA